MQFKFSHKKVLTMFAVLTALLFSMEVSAQFGNIFSAGKGSKKDKSQPTLISSDAMDLDMANDKVTLLGNVHVQDPELGIKCRKMEIYLGKSDKAEKADKSDKSGRKKSSDIREEQSSKEVVRIVCVGDVVISRGTAADVTEKQQAFAGKAVYLIKEDKITLTEDPVVVNGPNRLVGDEIILFPKTERVIVTKGVYRGKGSFMNESKPKGE